MDRATVLFVDDEPDALRSRQHALEESLNVIVRHPQDVGEDDLHRAQLVLVDNRLGEWPERDALTVPALMPIEGRGLVAVLRGHVESGLARTPTAFAIHTAHPEDFSPSFPAETRLHTLARLNNLEWVFAKTSGTGSVSLDVQIAQLAQSVLRLPPAWYPQSPERNLALAAELLALDPDIPWFNRAWEEVIRCHPPIHELSEDTHGLAFLRWLLHRILPYPCFLWDSIHLAARLRVTPESLVTSLETSTQFRDALLPAQYSGVLNRFLGARWWRQGIETFLWESTEGASFDLEQVHATLRNQGGESLEPLTKRDVVVCIGADLNTWVSIEQAENCVRVQPDDWPPYADPAWTSLELARSDPRVGALVMPEDYHLLSSREPT